MNGQRERRTTVGGERTSIGKKWKTERGQDADGMASTALAEPCNAHGCPFHDALVHTVEA